MAINTYLMLSIILIGIINLLIHDTRNQKRKPNNAVILQYLTSTRLSQPSLTCWARCRRCVEYFTRKLSSPCAIQDTGQDNAAELASFLDRLWCRTLLVNKLPKSNEVTSVPKSGIEENGVHLDGM